MRAAKMNGAPLLAVMLLMVMGATSADSAGETTKRAYHRSSWLPDTYPHPSQAACRSGDFTRLCDPDSILLTEEMASPLGKALETNRNIKCQDRDVGVQFAVALCQKMDLTSTRSTLAHHDAEAAAEMFARQIHDTWGVGEVSDCGGTGILIFLSDYDRTIYISRGSALEWVLTDRRLDKTIHNMKPLLKRQRYSEALIAAVQELDDYLIAGEPNYKERMAGFFVQYSGYLWLFGLFGLAGWAISKEQQQRREYAKVASQLDELDKARAEALQGRFQTKSCPICLESFQCSEVTTEETNTEESDNSATDENTKASNVEDKNGNKEIRKGSDGLPLKLLRCGHVFDETCWVEYVSSGHRGKVNKCPICQQDVGKNEGDATPSKRTDGSTVRRRTDGTTSPASADQSTSTTTTVPIDILRAQGETQSWAMRQYIRDRNFRLMRLGSRYPQYVRPQQISRWTSVGYNGSLSRDPAFVASDPVRVQQNTARSGRRGGGSSGSSGSFGGGSSGGGRGGRW